MVTQSADFLLILGSRLNIRQISYNWASFAREAFKAWVDVDPVELQKPTVKADLPVCADLKDIIPALIDAAPEGPLEKQREWLVWAKERGPKFPVVLPEYQNHEPCHPYVAVEALFNELAEDEVIVTGNGSACVVSFQTADLKRGQRLWTNSGCATMDDLSAVPDGSAALVVMVHVLDHILDPKAMLEQIRRKLKPGGRVAIVTHNEQSLLRSLMGKRWPPFCLQHPELYNPRSITKLLNSAGYGSVEVHEWCPQGHKRIRLL